MNKFTLSLISIIVLSIVLISCSDDKSTNIDNTPKFRIIEDNLYSYQNLKSWSSNKTTNYTYDELGRIVEKDFIDYSDYEESYTDSFFYELSSKYPRECRRYRDVGKLATLSGKITFTYENGKPKEIIEYIKYTDTGEIAERTKINYIYENNLIVNETYSLYNIDAETWEFYSDYDLNYIDEKITSTNMEMAGGGSGLETFTYSGDKLTEVNIDYTIWTFHFKYRYLLSYENGNVASAEIQDFDDGESVWLQDGKMEFNFVNDKLAERIYYRWNDSKEWFESYKNTYTYDTHELISLVENFSWNTVDSTYILSDGNSKQEYLYEDGEGNYTELDICLNPLLYYTGEYTNLIQPEEKPVKSTGIFGGTYFPSILKNVINEKLDAALTK